MSRLRNRDALRREEESDRKWLDTLAHERAVLEDRISDCMDRAATMDESHGTLTDAQHSGTGGHGRRFYDYYGAMLIA